MSEDITQRLPDQTPLLEQILARFDSFEQSVNARLERLEARSYDTKPIWERALAEVAELRQEMNTRFDALEARVDKVEVRLKDDFRALKYELRAFRREIEDLDERVTQLETPQA